MFPKAWQVNTIFMEKVRNDCLNVRNDSKPVENCRNFNKRMQNLWNRLKPPNERGSKNSPKPQLPKTLQNIQHWCVWGLTFIQKKSACSKKVEAPSQHCLRDLTLQHNPMATPHIQQPSNQIQHTLPTQFKYVTITTLHCDCNMSHDHVCIMSGLPNVLVWGWCNFYPDQSELKAWDTVLHKIRRVVKPGLLF